MTSDESVLRATGKTWRAWFRILDRVYPKMLRASGGDRPKAHKEAARYLYEHHLKKGWWCQMVTVEYEKARNLRTVGETRGVGFEVGATKTIQVSPDRAWKFLTSPRGLAVWFGKAPGLKIAPGETYKTASGTTGEIRTVRRGERVRLTWQPAGRKQSSTLQVTVIPRKSMRGTCISFHQEKLASAAERAKMRKHWQGVLGRLAKLL